MTMFSAGIQTSNRLAKFREALERRAGFVELVEACGLKKKTDFIAADLSNFNLSGQDFRGFDFANASFSNADLTGASFLGARFSGAEFSGAILDDVKWPAGKTPGSVSSAPTQNETSGRFNPRAGLDFVGLHRFRKANFNQMETALFNAAISRGEGEGGIGGSLYVETGRLTGRSPKDKFFVDEVGVSDNIWWDNNQSISAEQFQNLKDDVFDYAAFREFFVQDLFAGADPANRLDCRIVTELAWHALFSRHMLRSPAHTEVESYFPEFTFVCVPWFEADRVRHGARSDTMIAISFEQKLVFICGTKYAGEIKKCVFSVLNYLLPEKGVLPMHCSANHAPDNPVDTAIFFGLAGTGKTTLSADPNRVLIGDDEHGWSDRGVFNFEGGCYAKTINLSAEAEPEIYATTKMFGTVIENMVYDEDTLELDFEDDSLTANMRCAYPLHYISNASVTGLGGHPKNIIMLTADAFGVLPPIARLSTAQAIYHFLSGFTSKVAGTERGVMELQPTFSTCFGAPFMPRRPEVYGNLLRDKIARHGATCWLVNTGWTGGAYGTGSRMPIKATRAMLSAALDGSLADVEYRKDPNFGFEVPLDVPGVTSILLDPRRTWDDTAAYDVQAGKLVHMFAQNFEQYIAHVDKDVLSVAVG